MEAKAQEKSLRLEDLQASRMRERDWRNQLEESYILGTYRHVLGFHPVHINMYCMLIRAKDSLSRFLASIKDEKDAEDYLTDLKCEHVLGHHPTHINTKIR
ncbi:hypothetical protein C5167_034920 [Papaver somniferum]|uniref:Uncharacterized protein n=1 Tax=Papaver somniferum TaxID=3469 RepID=A0A4Y7KHT4_PAPSO|nr:hypothetical protein C5167_034920 [Papaver somniferum]